MTTEQKIAKAQELIAKGTTVGAALERVGISAGTYYSRRNVGNPVTAKTSEPTPPDWRDFAAEGLINANISTQFKVGALRELYSR
jgi:hypothetical protein